MSPTPGGNHTTPRYARFVRISLTRQTTTAVTSRARPFRNNSFEIHSKWKGYSYGKHSKSLPLVREGPKADDFRRGRSRLEQGYSNITRTVNPVHTHRLWSFRGHALPPVVDWCFMYQSRRNGTERHQARSRLENFLEVPSPRYRVELATRSNRPFPRPETLEGD